jgi:ATP phosphoribosyltransferase
MSEISTSNEIRASSEIRLALPKGRMQDGVLALLAEAGIRITSGNRSYRPKSNLAQFEVKILKPQNIVEMLHLGSRDLGFAGADWVAELDAELVDLLDTGLDPVRIVAAAPHAVAARFPASDRRLVLATEYVRLAERWVASRSLDACCVRSYGATEVFPPEDADCIVDNMSTGSTLEANNLVVLDELMTSSTHLYCNARALDDPEKCEAIESFVLLVRSVLEARSRVMLELNVNAPELDRIVGLLPSMREATIAQLYRSDAYAVKSAVPRAALPTLIPKLKQAGGMDIVISSLSQIVR